MRRGEGEGEAGRGAARAIVDLGLHAMMLQRRDGSPGRVPSWGRTARPGTSVLGAGSLAVEHRVRESQRAETNVSRRGGYAGTWIYYLRQLLSIINGRHRLLDPVLPTRKGLPRATFPGNRGSLPARVRRPRREHEQHPLGKTRYQRPKSPAKKRQDLGWVAVYPVRAMSGAPT